MLKERKIWHKNQVLSIDELEEKWLTNENTPQYVTMHKGEPSEPFYVVCKGENYFVSRRVKPIYGMEYDYHYYDDCGIRPYPSGWNESNCTCRWVPIYQWIDDWF